MPAETLLDFPTCHIRINYHRILWSNNSSTRTYDYNDEIVYVDITTEGETVAKEEVFGTIEAVKTVSDLFMPVSGEVLEVNAELEDAPELVNEDAYGKGWLIKISLTDASELEELLSAEDYQKLIAK